MAIKKVLKFQMNINMVDNIFRIIYNEMMVETEERIWSLQIKGEKGRYLKIQFSWSVPTLRGSGIKMFELWITEKKNQITSRKHRE